jgi:regulator of replication initiation timing
MDQKFKNKLKKIENELWEEIWSLEKDKDELVHENEVLKVKIKRLEVKLSEYKKQKFGSESIKESAEDHNQISKTSNEQSSMFKQVSKSLNKLNLDKITSKLPEFPLESPHTLLQSPKLSKSPISSPKLLHTSSSNERADTQLSSDNQLFERIRRLEEAILKKKSIRHA